MEFSTIEVQAAGQSGRITLNRPAKLNPLSTTTLEELVEAARWFDSQQDVKVVVVEGRGRSFSAGADLVAFGAGASRSGQGNAVTQASRREAADAGRRMADAVEAMRAVTIARIQGHCVGGALVLAAACDLRVATDTANFFIPEVDLGIPLAWGGIPRLVREIGPALAKELVMTCRPFTSAEAQAAGFLNRVVPDAGLDAEVEALVAQLVGKSSLTLTATKRHVNAVTEGMVGTARSWSDADSLVTAQGDTESRALAANYLSTVRAGGRAETETP